MNRSGLTLIGQGRSNGSKSTRQPSSGSSVCFEKYGRKSRRELFLEAMNELVPWQELEAMVEPHYPKSPNGGRPAGLSVMLRVFFLQQWFKVSDAGIEEALYDSAALRRFVGIDLKRAPAPDVTNVTRFHHLLDAHELGDKIIETVSRHLDEKGVRISAGSIADASIIYAPN